MSSEGTPALDGPGQELYARIAPSLVLLEVKGRDGGRFQTVGAVIKPGLVAAWIGLVSGAAGWGELLDVTVRQGGRSWRAELRGFRHLWWTCVVYVTGEFPLPPVQARRSTSLEPGQRVLAVGMDASGRRVAWGSLGESQRCTADQPYDRSMVWFILIDEPGCSHHALGFDEAGRLVGLVESPSEMPQLGALLPGERLTGHVGRAFTEMLLTLGEHAHVVRNYREQPEVFVDAESLCAVGLACQALSDVEGALQAWSRAADEDPKNPWPHQASGEALASLGRFDEANAAFARASRLEEST